MPWPDRLSLNLQTTAPRPLDEVLAACKAAGVTGVGLYRPPNVEPFGFPRALEIVKESGIDITVYASVGFWTNGIDAQGRPRDLKANVEMLDEAVQLGCPLLGTSAGDFSPGDKDFPGARQRVIAGLRELAPYAAERGLKLGIEPVHPMYGPRLVYTLHQALDLCEEVGHPAVGVIADTFHQWWEPDLVEQLKRGVATNRIFLVQVSDWTRERTRTRPFSRAIMGEGSVDFDLFLEGLQDYTGLYDIEILANEELQAMPLPALIERLAEAHQQTIGSKLR